MLSLVGYPCAINPDSRLRAHAEEQDWQIQDYQRRKAARLGLLGALGRRVPRGGGRGNRVRRPAPPKGLVPH